MRTFTAKNIVITGAGSGIGRALAIELARLNAFLILSDNDSKSLLETQRILKDMQIDSACYELDVSDYQAMNNFATSVHRQYGDIDMLINNAGVTLMDQFEDGNLADFHWVMNINFWGTVNGVKAFLPNLLRRKDACIVNLSSIFGIMGMPGQAAYNSSKAGVRLLSKSVALYCAKKGYDVRCNTVHPAFIDTPILDPIKQAFGNKEAIQKLSRQIPMNKIGDTDDVAYAVIYLASDESKFMTGSEIILDGGLSAM